MSAGSGVKAQVQAVGEDSRSLKLQPHLGGGIGYFIKTCHTLKSYYKSAPLAQICRVFIHDGGAGHHSSLCRLHLSAPIQPVQAAAYTRLQQHIHVVLLGDGRAIRVLDSIVSLADQERRAHSFASHRGSAFAPPVPLSTPPILHKPLSARRQLCLIRTQKQAPLY